MAYKFSTRKPGSQTAEKRSNGITKKKKKERKKERKNAVASVGGSIEHCAMPASANCNKLRRQRGKTQFAILNLLRLHFSSPFPGWERSTALVVARQQMHAYMCGAGAAFSVRMVLFLIVFISPKRQPSIVRQTCGKVVVLCYMIVLHTYLHTARRVYIVCFCRPGVFIATTTLLSVLRLFVVRSPGGGPLCSTTGVALARWAGVLRRVLGLGLVVVLTFGALWGPFCIFSGVADGSGCLSSLGQASVPVKHQKYHISTVIPP